MDVHRSSVRYPGGLSARYRWVGSGGIGALAALTEVGGELVDHGALAVPDPERACRAEVRVEGPKGVWTARFASTIHDEPIGWLWDVPGLLMVKYGFAAYALDARSGVLRWSYVSRTPLVAVLGSSRLGHAIAQTEVETVALAQDGEVVWRVAHRDVVVEAELVGGRLVLTGYGGLVAALDPRTGVALDG
jgi:hypothetical protein